MSKQSTSEPKKENEENQPYLPVKKKCGIIMPIADHPGYPAGHWKEVLQIIKDSLSDTDFEVKLVSDSNEIGLIHERIVTNIYTNEVVICDVSCKNPNVMFELGMRLAFDKPTIIIKDETTGYSFDTSVIEHINYQSNLRHSTIELFKAELKRRVLSTYEESKNDPEHSPFLKGFGRHIVAKTIQKSEISEGQYIIEKLDFLIDSLLSPDSKYNITNNLVVAENQHIIEKLNFISTRLFPPLPKRSFFSDISGINKSVIKEVTDAVNNALKAIKIMLLKEAKEYLLKSYSLDELKDFLYDKTASERILESTNHSKGFKISLAELQLLILEIIYES